MNPETTDPLSPLRPDYAGGSLLNLMQTLQLKLGAPPAASYPELYAHYGLGPETLAGVDHIMLVVIDGLGERQLSEMAPQSWLARHSTGTLTSVFPSTTASAIPTFLSGLAPQQHGLAG